MTSIVLVLFFAVAAVQAFPALVARDSQGYIPGLTTEQINSFNPYTYYAKAVYCGPKLIMSWSCGTGCNGNKGFKPEAAGGDGGGEQYWYVGYDPTLKTVIVAHQGTNTSQIKAVLTDLDIIKEGLDSDQFPGITHDGIKVHQGFLIEHAKTARTILSNVQITMSKYGATSVTMVGHSLGAALALLDSVYLPLHLPPNTKFKTVVYGLPRVGNQKFADYVDQHVSLTRINNMKDPIPIVPGKWMGFVHPYGEIHIEENGKWARCQGQDNNSKECSVGDVPSIYASVEANHDGPYNGIRMLCHT